MYGNFATNQMRSSHPGTFKLTPWPREDQQSFLPCWHFAKSLSIWCWKRAKQVKSLATLIHLRIHICADVHAFVYVATWIIGGQHAFRCCIRKENLCLCSVSIQVSLYHICRCGLHTYAELYTAKKIYMLYIYPWLYPFAGGHNEVGWGGVKFFQIERKITSVVHSHPPSHYIRTHAFLPTT